MHVETLAASPAHRRRALPAHRPRRAAPTATTSPPGDVIAGYLAAETLDDLLELVLARYERDFEADRPGLIADAFRAVWAARRGLTEPELLDLLGGAGAAVTPCGRRWCSRPRRAS